MLFLYAGLGMAMLLPIMAGLQISVALAELEAGNDQLLMERKDSRRALMSEESSFMRQAIDSFREQVDLVSKTSATCPVVGGGFQLVGATGSSVNCPYWLEPNVEDYPLLSRQGRGRFFIRLSSSGVVDVRDACFIDFPGNRPMCPEEG